MGTTPREPETEAGHEMLAWLEHGRDVRERILAIEAELRAKLAAAILAALEGSATLPSDLPETDIPGPAEVEHARGFREGFRRGRATLPSDRGREP